jgi:hypothetical protein
MRLLPHPATLPGPVRSLVAAAGRSDGGLHLRFTLDADLARLRVPSPVSPARADSLWHHTCFEAFVAVRDAPAYCEFNFAPSGEWSAYAFSGYREDMSAPALQSQPQLHWRRDERSLGLEARLALDGLLPDPREPLRLALAAVVEDESGTIGYWALRHPAGKPDFHHPAGFVLELPAAN